MSFETRRIGPWYSSPCYYAGDCRVRAGHTEERPEILHPNGRVGDVDREADQAQKKSCANEGRTHLERVGGDRKDHEYDHCVQRERPSGREVARVMHLHRRRAGRLTAG